ncbi:MAG: EVE domain-containing protein [Geminicoccaceae bacterium]
MAHWLMKTEPEDYSWERLVADKETEWTGVRNRQAANNMRAMKKGEEILFYRSQVDPAVLGIMKISAEAYPDPDDATGKFCRVKVKPVRALQRPVTLKEIKADSRFSEMVLVRNSRLSVQPVGDEHWKLILDLSGKGS